MNEWFISIHSMETFENLHIRQESWKLFDELFVLFTNDAFKHYFFRDQILRAALSINNNIAEWYETKTLAERKQFLNYAKRSCGEVRSMLYRAHACWMITWQSTKHYINQAKKISIMIYRFSSQQK